MTKISQGFAIINVEQIVNIYQIFGKVLFKHKVYGTKNDHLPVLPGNEQDLGHENIVNTYLFYQVCKCREVMTFQFQTFLPKTGVSDGNSMSKN